MDLLAREQEETEVIHLLIETAIQMRITQERFINEVPDKLRKIAESEVGALWQPTSSPESCPLLLREACNKIIHAEKIMPQSSGDTPDGRRTFTSTIHLSGDHNAVPWRATLEVPRFVAEAFGIAKMTWTF